MFLVIHLVIMLFLCCWCCFYCMCSCCGSCWRCCCPCCCKINTSKIGIEEDDNGNFKRLVLDKDGKPVPRENKNNEVKSEQHNNSKSDKSIDKDSQLPVTVDQNGNPITPPEPPPAEASQSSKDKDKKSAKPKVKKHRCRNCGICCLKCCCCCPIIRKRKYKY